MVITTSANFINEFHNIQGDRIGLRKQNLYAILKASRLPSKELELLSENLQPKNYLEVVFHADVLIYFKITNALLKFFKKGHEVYVSKIMKQNWFFEEVFKNVAPNRLVEELLPTVSYSVKIKLLKKLLPILSPDQVDEIFDNLLRKYGLYFASRILPDCSTQKIKDTLKTHDINLPTFDLKRLCKKDFNLIEIYFEEKKIRKNGQIFTRNFYTYLAKNNPDFFWKVLRSNKPYVRLGRRNTKTVLIHIEKQEILNDLKSHFSTFKRERAIRILNQRGHLSEFYVTLYPEELSNLANEDILKSILEYYPEQKRYDLFKTTFERAYNEDILSNSKFIDTGLLNFIGENQEFREKWAHLKFAETGKVEYMGYLSVKEAMPLLKTRINMTNQLKDRNELLGILLKCCAVNKDMAALEEVLHYFCERHRNAAYETRQQFLTHFKYSFEKKFSEFSDAIWKYFIELVTIQLATDRFVLSTNVILIGKYLEHLYEKNDEAEVNTFILKCLPSSTASYFSFPNFDDFVKDVNFKKKILISAYKFSKTVKLPIENRAKDRYLLCFLRLLLEFNMKYAKHRIVLDEVMQNDIKGYFMKKEYHYFLVECICPTLCKSNLNDFEKEILPLVWEHLFQEYIDRSQIKFLKWFWTNQPLALVQHFDKIVKMFLHNSSNLRRVFWFRSFSHLSLDDIIKKYCSIELLGRKTFILQSNSVLWLSHQLSTEEYIKMGEDNDLFPANLKLDTKNIEAAYKFKLQKWYLESIKNTSNPSEYLALILEKYCQGDCLQACLPPVYKAFSKIPEESLKPYLENALKRENLSFSKHLAVLACNLFDLKTAIDTLKIFEEAKNKSLKKYAFRSVLKYFSRSPNKELFDVLLVWIPFLLENDLESLKSLFEVRIDKEFQVKYLELSWNSLKGFKNNSQLINIKQSCLNLLNGTNFEKLDNSFCKEIIQDYFLVTPELPDIYLFVINFLLFNKQEENFNFLFQIILNFKAKDWSDFKPSNLKKINQFVKTFVTVVHQREVELDVLEKFFENWKSVFLPHEAFQEHLLLKFVMFWKMSHDLKMFASQIIQYLGSICKEYDEYFTANFACILSQFLDFEGENVKLNLLLHVMESSDLRLASSLVIDLLKIKHDFVYENNIKKKYTKIDAVLKQVQDKSIKLKYNLLLTYEMSK